MPGFGAVKERTFELIETGEYCLTLNDLEFEADGPYGDSMKWDWLVAPREDPTAYIYRADGNERTIRVWTGADIELGSQCHEWVQVLLGKTLEKGDEPPDMDDLLGKRMVAYITHQAPKRGPNAGKMREKIVAGSAKRFGGPHKTVARNAPARPEPTGEELMREALVEKIGKLIGRCVKLETPNHAAYVALDLAEADDDQLEQLLATVQQEVQDALDG